MDNITYRKAEISDCFSIASLKGKVWRTTYQGIYSEESLINYDVEKNRKIFEQIVNNPDIQIYVALISEQIVGFMTCGKPYKGFQDFSQEIGLLYILKEYQRQGIGRSLFELARKQVRNAGYNRFFLSVNKKNANAIAFYLAMGGQALLADDSQIKIVYTLT